MEDKNIWARSFSNKQLELIIFVTEQCNFRCVYCYEDFKLGKLTDSVIIGLKNLISNRISEIQVLSLSFFGGEPLLNKTAILELSNWAKNLCENNSVLYHGSITTNGYLLDKQCFESLIKCGINSYQITLDGEKEQHDKLRPSIGGKSTFDRIYVNLKNMAKATQEFHCTIRFNVADYNLDSVKSFLTNYFKPFLNDDRFKIHFHQIFGLPEIQLTNQNHINELKELAESKGFKFPVPSNHSVCYAARADSFVVRSDGRIQKCTVALENEINTVGKLSPDGSLNINAEKFKKWVFAENKECPVQSLSLEKLAFPYDSAGKYDKDDVFS